MSPSLEHHPGDVILFANSTDCVGRLIQDVDDSPYSHSGLAVGPDELSHITGNGSELSTISARTNDTGIYHLITSHGSGATDDRIEAICAEGRRLADATLEYGDTQVVLAGLLLLTRRLPGWIRFVAAPVLSAFARVVDDAVDDDGQLMICSDYVYRCFDAGGVELLPDGMPPIPHSDDPTLDEWLGDSPNLARAPSLPDLPPKEELLDWLCERVERIRRTGPADVGLHDHQVVDEIRQARNAAHQALRTALGPRPDGEVLPDFVTPGDLLRGGVLTERGRWSR